jgi:MFS family permease
MGYQLATAFAAVMVAAGRLADIFGRRRLLLIGIAVFIVASSLCGLAQAGWWLIAVQGIGAGVFLTALLSIVSSAFPPDEQSKGIGVWAGVIGIGIAVGPFVGGFLTEVASWRWFFFVNIPIALLAVFLTLRVVRESRDETTGRHVDLFRRHHPREPYTRYRTELTSRAACGRSGAAPGIRNCTGLACNSSLR